mmetsp:Transcript_10666/g.13839  ORF Transcript_10666/g.13839 Transcript_10666/m.13839 type:complete len:295 (-) Transcript_10666:1007-1891(-)
MFFSILSDIFSDFHGAEFWPTHRTEVGGFSSVSWDGFVVVCPSSDWVKSKVELIFPSEFKSGFRKSIIPVLSIWVSLCKISSMSCNSVSNQPSFDIITVWQPQMFLWGNITQHSAAHCTNICSANARGNVIVSGSNISGQRAQGVERSFMAPLQLVLHIDRDFVKRHVPRSLVHDLNILFPSTFGEFTLDLEFSKLSFIISIIDRSWSEPITYGKSYIVFVADVKDVIPVLISKVFFMVGQAMFSMDRTTTGDNAGHSVDSHWDKTEQDSSMDCPVVNPLLCLFNQRITEDLPS